MPSLSIKNVPDELVSHLKARAKLHHRSLQGELVTILEEAVQLKKMSVGEVHERVRDLGLTTGSESVMMVREDRDGR